MTTLVDLAREVERRMESGDSFEDVEDTINSSGLSDQEKSALWLLGWSYVDAEYQRREALAHIARITGGGPLLAVLSSG